jgi:hypothetical protein
MGPESRDPQRVLTPCAHNMVLGDGEDDVAVGVVFDLREGTLVARKQNRPHVDGVDERGDVSGGGGVIGGRCPTNLMTLLSLSGCQLRSGMVLALTDRPAQTAVAPTRRRDASARRFPASYSYVLISRHGSRLESCLVIAVRLILSLLQSRAWRQACIGAALPCGGPPAAASPGQSSMINAELSYMERGTKFGVFIIIIVEE